MISCNDDFTLQIRMTMQSKTACQKQTVATKNKTMLNTRSQNKTTRINKAIQEGRTFESYSYTKKERGKENSRVYISTSLAEI